ncbi:MAG: M61 family metallopeptidase, partial [bacterium]
MTELSYTVTTAGPETHLFQVEMTLSGPSQSQQLRLPAWIPGSYMIRDFARNIVAITARLDDEPVPIKQLDKQTWQIDGHGEQLLVRYQVYAGDLSVRGAHLDHTHGYFNGSALFLCPVGMEDTEAVVVLVKPAAEEYRRWRLATSMTPAVLDDHGFGEYRAEDYEDLIDHPVEMGEFSHHEFEVEGVPHQLVLTGRFDADLKRISSDLTKICTQHAALFGGLPLDRYVFLTQVTGSDYGGLEHRFSTSLIAPRSDLPVPGDEKVSEGYRRFLGLCSHEYFHLWNVKRIRPEVLKEADLSSEVYTSLLWAFEGITSYYDDLGLLRAGCISLEEYLDTLAQTITRVMRGSGRHKQSVAESSFNAWSKFYKQDENASNAIVSYYAKGTLVALGLDVLIRE